MQIATLHKNHNNTDIVFDIAPLKQTVRNKNKRSLNANEHVIFKRAAADDLKQIRETQFIPEIIDFQETKGLNQKLIFLLI